MAKRSTPSRRIVRPSGAPQGPRQAEIKRAAILSAAGALFDQYGVEATTTEQIATRAGVAKGTLYHYFSSKSEIIAALRDQFCMEFTGRIMTAIATCDPDDWNGKLRLWVRTSVDAYFSMSSTFQMLFHRVDLLRFWTRRDILFVQKFRDLLQDGANAGIWQVEDPLEIAIIMFCGINGSTEEAFVTGRPASEVSTLLSALFLRMLGTLAERSTLSS